MPGMSGYELAGELRSRSRGRPPVLAAVTGFRDLDHVEKAERAGFDLYFTKPVDPGELAEKLCDCM